MTLEVRGHGKVGAEILGVDLASGLAGAELELVRAAFAEHGVIFFRDQHLSEEQHIAFARLWGEININRFFAAHPAYPEIALVVKEPGQQHNIGGGWHTDHSYDPEPALGSVLIARELPPEGGNTVFASMYLAYDALPDHLKREIAGLRAIHSARHVFGTAARGGYRATDVDQDRIGNAATADVLADVEHPVAVTHPLSGRKALFVNPAFTTGIAGWDEGASADLLTQLFDHARKPEFAEDFVWSAGSIAFWDNRATWHLARNDYHGHRRELHRITIEGGPLG